MRILHILAGIEETSGVAVSAAAYARHEIALGHQVAVAACYDLGGLDFGRSEKFVFGRDFPKMIFYSRRMRRELPALVKSFDLVHIHCQWTFPVWFGAWSAARAGVKYVMMPHGSFDPVRLAHSAWKKRLVSAFDHWAVRHAELVIATSEKEKKWILSWESKVKRVLELPLGVEISEFASLRVNEFANPRKSGHTEIRTLLYLGRIHPLKGLDLLLDALSLAKDVKIRLIICGTDEEGTCSVLRKQAVRLGVIDSVEFHGPVTGAEKWKMLCASDCLILPTRSDNYGIVVAEALACGKPVICTKGAPWSVLESHHLGWWTDINAEALAWAINKFSASSDAELSEIGTRASKYAKDHLTWPTAVNGLVSCFK